MRQKPGPSETAERVTVQMNHSRPGTPTAMEVDAAAIEAIQVLRRQGFTTAADLARALNERGVTMSKGERWHAMQVQRLLANGTTERIRPSSPHHSTQKVPGINWRVTGEQRRVVRRMGPFKA